MGKILYNENEVIENIKNLFFKLGRIPTKSDFKNLNIKPERTWFTNKYGSLEQLFVDLKLIDAPISKEERMRISIVELINLANTLNRIPTKDEYTNYRKDGYSMFPLQKHLNMTFTEICEKYLQDFKYIVNDGYKKCSICNKIKPIDEFGVSTNSKYGKRAACKLCEYISRNGIVVPDNWNKEEYIIVLDHILNEKVKYINELCDVLSNKRLYDIVELLSSKLKIANKPLNIKTYCDYCGKEEIKCLSVYLKNKNYFCSNECYWNYKKESEPKGKDNHQYKRIAVKCDNCGCDIEVIPFDFKNRKHNFCSQECYWEFRSKFYISENHPQFGIKRTEKQRQNSRIITTKMYKDGVFDRQTKPQKVINKILTELNIEYINEYNCKYYSIDNYLPQFNLMIEVMGDYFHANPNDFQVLNDMQYKNIVKDKKKRTYIKKYKSTNILYLWENEINNNVELVKKLVINYIECKGFLPEYNSFNYYLENDNILIKSDMKLPYFHLTSKKLSNMRISKSEYEQLKKMKKEERRREKYITFNCDCCGETVERLKIHYYGRKSHFCSKECFNRYIKNK